MKKTLVVGAGVIGLLCAYEIRRRGGDVTVIDKGEPGGGCSLANTGWVVPSFSSPLPGPGMIGATLKWMLSADSPLYIRPSCGHHPEPEHHRPVRCDQGRRGRLRDARLGAAVRLYYPGGL